MTHNTHAELVRELTSRWPEHRVAPSLSRVAALMELLGDPQRAMLSVETRSNPLTEREREILALAAGGGPVSQIAASLHLSAGTVRNHLSNAIGKTNTSNRIEAARTAREMGWI